jgi:hypothetical protein
VGVKTYLSSAESGSSLTHDMYVLLRFRKRERAQDDEEDDVVPLSKRINNMHVGRGGIIHPELFAMQQQQQDSLYHLDPFAGGSSESYTLDPTLSNGGGGAGSDPDCFMSSSASVNLNNGYHHHHQQKHNNDISNGSGPSTSSSSSPFATPKVLNGFHHQQHLHSQKEQTQQGHQQLQNNVI